MNAMKADGKTLIEDVGRLEGKKILIVGDVGLDEYVIGKVRRISPEAPVPVVEVSEEDERLGLASNLAANVASLKGEPFLVGVVGPDETGERFRKLLNKNQCRDDVLVVASDRPTTRKLRVLAGQHHVVRVDYEKKRFLTTETEDKILNQVRELLPQVDGVIIEDYAKGVLSERVVQTVIKDSHAAGKIVTLDPSRYTPTDIYKGADYITPNTDEALVLSELPIDDLRSHSESLHEVGGALLKRLEAQAVVITRGKDGMSAFSKGGPSEGQHVPTFAQSVFDVTGAGDTVIAAFTLALVAGLGLEKACLLANYAAGVVVSKMGCVSADPQELVAFIRDHGPQ